MSGVMNDEQRVSALLEMARQYMQRFHELEEIEWKINFSVWALFGGLAYLWVNAKSMTTPGLLKGRYAFLLVLFAVGLHGLALFMLNRQERQIASLRDNRRDDAARLVGIAVQEYEPHYVGGIRWRDWGWIAWNLIVTATMATAVVFLMRLH